MSEKEDCAGAKTCRDLLRRVPEPHAGSEKKQGSATEARGCTNETQLTGESHHTHDRLLHRF
jgi:hypothetical protein